MHLPAHCPEAPWGLGAVSCVLAFLKADHGPMFGIMMACWIWAKLGPFWGPLMKSAFERKSKSFGGLRLTSF